MRRLISIFVLGFFALPLLPTLMLAAEGAETRLPACCRRTGTHSCTMTAQRMAESESGAHHWVARGVCAMVPSALAPTHPTPYALDQPVADNALVFLESPKLSRVEAWARISKDGARCKRGPPSPPLS